MNIKEAMRDRLREAVLETISLRFEGSLPPTSAGPEEVMQSLAATRQRLDRIEELMIEALRVRATAKRNSSLASAEASDQWDQAVRTIGTSSAVRGPEFQGPRERYSAANLDTLDARRESRQAEELLSIADEAYEAIRAMYWGLNGVRQDHDSMLKAMQFADRLGY